MVEDPRAMPSDPAAARQVQQNQVRIARVMAQAMADPAFKQRLQTNPTQVLTENGVETHGWQFQVVDHAPSDSVDFNNKIAYIEIPQRPAGQLSEEQLAGVAGGGYDSSAGTAGTGGSIVSCAGSVGSASSKC